MVAFEYSLSAMWLWPDARESGAAPMRASLITQVGILPLEDVPDPPPKTMKVMVGAATIPVRLARIRGDEHVEIAVYEPVAQGGAFMKAELVTQTGTLPLPDVSEPPQATMTVTIGKATIPVRLKRIRREAWPPVAVYEPA